MKVTVPATLLLPLLGLTILTTASCLALNVGVRTSTDVLIISHHKTVELTESRAHEILRQAIIAIRKDSQVDEDYDCELDFKRVVVKEFDFDISPATVTGVEHMKLLERELGQIKVVGAINWDCDENNNGRETITAGGGKVWGCSPSPGNYIVVQHEVDPVDPATDGVLWLHELGHNAGLVHSDQAGALNTHDNAVMYQWIDKAHVVLNKDECRLYHGL